MNLFSTCTKETLSLSSKSQTHAKKLQLLTLCSLPPQFQLELCQTAVSFQHPSVSQSRSSGRKVKTQTLWNLRTPCSSSRLCLFLHKWTSKNSASNWRRCSIPITWIFCSAPIIFLPRFNRTCLIQTRCSKCNRDKCNSCSNKEEVNHLVAQAKCKPKCLLNNSRSCNNSSRWILNSNRWWCSSSNKDRCRCNSSSRWCSNNSRDNHNSKRKYCVIQIILTCRFSKFLFESPLIIYPFF